MAFNMSHDHPLFTNPLFGLLRVLQIIFNIVVIGLVAAEFSQWHSSGCSAPGRLTADLALAVISFPLVLYQLLTTSPITKVLPFIPWSKFATLAIDVLLFLIWIIAAPLATLPNCSDLCSACSSFGVDNYNDNGDSTFTVSSGTKFCNCRITPSRRKLKRGDDIFANTMSFEKRNDKPNHASSEYQGKVALNWIMFVLCLLALVLTIVMIVFFRDSTGAVPRTNEPKPADGPVYNPPPGPTIYPTPPPPGSQYATPQPAPYPGEGATYAPAGHYPQESYANVPLSPSHSGYTQPSGYSNSPPLGPVSEANYAPAAPAHHTAYSAAGSQPSFRQSVHQPAYPGQPGYMPNPTPPIEEEHTPVSPIVGPPGGTHGYYQPQLQQPHAQQGHMGPMN